MPILYPCFTLQCSHFRFLSTYDHYSTVHAKFKLFPKTKSALFCYQSSSNKNIHSSKSHEFEQVALKKNYDKPY